MLHNDRYSDDDDAFSFRDKCSHLFMAGINKHLKYVLTQHTKTNAHPPPMPNTHTHTPRRTPTQKRYWHWVLRQNSRGGNVLPTKQNAVYPVLTTKTIKIHNNNNNNNNTNKNISITITIDIDIETIHGIKNNSKPLFVVQSSMTLASSCKQFVFPPNGKFSTSHAASISTEIHGNPILIEFAFKKQMEN